MDDNACRNPFFHDQSAPSALPRARLVDSCRRRRRAQYADLLPRVRASLDRRARDGDRLPAGGDESRDDTGARDDGTARHRGHTSRRPLGNATERRGDGHPVVPGGRSRVRPRADQGLCRRARRLRSPEAALGQHRVPACLRGHDAGGGNLRADTRSEGWKPSAMNVRLSDIRRAFQGLVPSIIATADSRGTPNVTYVSQVYFLDDSHVALSCQFFNKTRRNLDENPNACAEVIDPVTLQAYRLKLRFLRSEKSGPLFDTMSLRIDAIASHTGMSGVFRLIAADVFEVVSATMVEGFLSGPADEPCESLSIEGARTEMRGLQWVSERINRATGLESLLCGVLEALEEYFTFSHTAILLHDEANRRLTTIASRGYGESGVGAEVGLGEGLIGTVARERRLLRLTSLDADLRYGRAIRREAACGTKRLDAEVPLPGL